MKNKHELPLTLISLINLESEIPACGDKIMKRFYTLTAACLMTSILTACWVIGDRGYSMEPVGMEKAGNQEQWTKKFDGFELQTNRIGGLIGEWWIAPQFAISTGSQPVTIESIELRTAKGVYPAKIGVQSRVIPALTNHEMLSVYWRFSEDTSASEIMGDSGRILFRLIVGSEEKFAVIAYARGKCC
jgi:hypothetical protein